MLIDVGYKKNDTVIYAKKRKGVFLDAVQRTKNVLRKKF